MPCSPASSRIMWNPKYFHEMTTNRVNRTIDRSASHELGEARRGRRWPGPRRRARPACSRSCQIDAGDDLGEDVRREEDQPEDRPAAEAPVEHQREAERERDLDDERQRDEERVVGDRAVEHRVGQGALVVGEPDEVGQRLQPVPLEPAVVDRLDDRDDDEDGVDEQRGQHEERGRRELRGSATRRSGCGRSQSRSSVLQGWRMGRRDAGPFDTSREGSAHWVLAASAMVLATPLGRPCPR